MGIWTGDSTCESIAGPLTKKEPVAMRKDRIASRILPVLAGSLMLVFSALGIDGLAADADLAAVKP